MINHSSLREIHVLLYDHQKISVVTNLICVYIGSFIWRGDGRVAERCIWINKDDLSNLQDSNVHGSDINTIPQLPVAFWGNSTSTPQFKKDTTPKAAANDYEVKNRGVLDDGTPFVIYRFLLYSDGFKQKKSLSDKRSVCGFYILPLGLSHKSRATSECARILSLSSYGQDTNDVFNLIIDDIVRGSTEGIHTIDAYGNKVVVFLDAAAKIGDFPAITEATDVSGHSSDSHCSFCSVAKRKGGTLPEIAFSTALHSRRLSLTRFDERMKTIRADNPSKTIRKHLGTSCGSEEEANQCFSVRLADALSKSNFETRKTQDGQPVLTNYYDSTLSAAACPDHLFKGLITNVLTVCFDCLPDDKMRQLADATICHYIISNGLPTIDTVLNWDKHGKYKGLNNLTTTRLVAYFCFRGMSSIILPRFTSGQVQIHFISLSYYKMSFL